jgi:hypothetical protein
LNKLLCKGVDGRWHPQSNACIYSWNLSETNQHSLKKEIKEIQDFNCKPYYRLYLHATESPVDSCFAYTKYADGDRSQEIYTFNPRTLREKKLVSHVPGILQSLSFSANGYYLIGSLKNNPQDEGIEYIIWNAKSGEEEFNADVHDYFFPPQLQVNPASLVAFSADNSMIVCANPNAQKRGTSSIEIYSHDTEGIDYSIECDYNIKSLALSHDKRTLAFVGEQRGGYFSKSKSFIEVWELNYNGAERIKKFSIDRCDEGNKLVLSPDGNFVAYNEPNGLNVKAVDHPLSQY